VRRIASVKGQHVGIGGLGEVGADSVDDGVGHLDDCWLELRRCIPRFEPALPLKKVATTFSENALLRDWQAGRSERCTCVLDHQRSAGSLRYCLQQSPGLRG